MAQAIHSRPNFLNITLAGATGCALTPVFAQTPQSKPVSRGIRPGWRLGEAELSRPIGLMCDQHENLFVFKPAFTPASNSLYANWGLDWLLRILSRVRPKVFGLVLFILDFRDCPRIPQSSDTSA